MKYLANACAILLSGLATVAQAQSLESDGMADDCTDWDTVGAPPAPPHVDAAGAALRGEVTLLIRIDRCGRPLRVEVEKSSGDPQLDDAAVIAAKSWHLPPRIEDGVAMESLVRVPVEFDPELGGPEPAATSRSRPRDAFFVGRRAMKAASPVRDGDGKVPGFVADEYPIGVASIEQAMAMLDRHGQRQPDPMDGMRQYELIDEEGISFWYLIGDPAQHAKALYRQRAVSDGLHGFWVTSFLCEPADASICGRFVDVLAGLPAQQDMPPPPSPPPPPPER